VGGLINSIQNIVTDEYKNQLIEYFENDKFEWVMNGKGGFIPLYSHRYNHPIITDSVCVDAKTFNIVLPIIHDFQNKTGIKIIKIKGCRINLLKRYKMSYEELKVALHTDAPSGLSIIYYVNDSDGDLVVTNDNKEIIDTYTPKAGSVAYFDSRLLHAATNPIISEKRMAIFFFTEIQ
jgi:hypothetical protein